MLRLLSPAVIGSLLLATVSTLVYYASLVRILPEGVFSFLFQGAAVFATLGWYLGWRQGWAARGAVGGFSIGVISALCLLGLSEFSTMVRYGGAYSILLAWLALWLMLAHLESHLEGGLAGSRAIGRGALAALVSSLGLLLLLFQLFRETTTEAFQFPSHFFAWFLAGFSGLYVVLKR